MLQRLSASSGYEMVSVKDFRITPPAAAKGSSSNELLHIIPGSDDGEHLAVLLFRK